MPVKEVLLEVLLEYLLGYLPIWLPLVVFVVLGLIWLSRHRVNLEIDDQAYSAWVDFETGRVYQSVVYGVEYPKLAFLSVWLHGLEIRYPFGYPRHIQVEDVSYIHPDLVLLDERTPFRRLGKMEISDKHMRLTIPKAVAKEALLLREHVEYSFPISISLPLYRLKGVKTIVMEISYPLNEADFTEPEVIDFEPIHRPDEYILCFVIRKNDRFNKVYRYRLRYPLPQCIKSFTENVACYPPTARIATTPQDISVISARPYNLFDRDEPGESYELDWVFDLTEDAIEVQFQYTES